MGDRALQSDAVLPLESVLHTKGKDQMEFTLPRGTVPEVLLTVFEAVLAHENSTAERALDDICLQAVNTAIVQNPAYADVMAFMLGVSFKRIGKLKEAEQWLTHIPDERANALVLNELAGIYQSVGRFSLELQTREKTLRKEPQNLSARVNYAIDMLFTRQYDQARAMFAQIVQDPDVSPEIHSIVLYYLHCFPEINPDRLYDEHVHWARIHTPKEQPPMVYRQNKNPERRLRIGYISANFSRHSVAANFEPFLQGRDHCSFEVFGYGNVATPDSVTDRLKELFDGYRDIYRMSDADMVSLIHQDQIDILVHIGGHVVGNRLTALTTKPAPIIVDYGAINTCGMEQIDYRLTDVLADPPERQPHYVEEFVYLEQGICCNIPPVKAPDVGPLPYEKNGLITFGAFNAHVKITPEAVTRWADIMHQVPDSRLIMKFPSGADSWIQGHYRHAFETLGITPDRLFLTGSLPDDVYLNLYNEVDIALDTYPYNGCLTTLECLWMGIPVMSRRGTCHVSRVGFDILSRIDLDYFACITWEEYVKKAVVLASSPSSLAQIRLSLRQKMHTSPLCDSHRYCREVEAAYRRMWYRYCDANCSSNGVGAHRV